MAVLSGCSLLDIERGPDWLIVRPTDLAGDPQLSTGFAEQIISLLDLALTHRVVLDLDRVPALCVADLDQLTLLHEQMLKRHGQLRICGLSSPNSEAVRSAKLDHVLPIFADRAAAVRCRPTPRPR